MAMTIGTLDVRVKFSMWQAIKIRVSGLFKNIDKFEQAGDVIKITYMQRS